jgi:hypothetical protein
MDWRAEYSTLLNKKATLQAQHDTDRQRISALSERQAREEAEDACLDRERCGCCEEWDEESVLCGIDGEGCDRERPCHHSAPDNPHGRFVLAGGDER